MSAYMVSFMRQTPYALLKKAALCLVFIGLLTTRAQAQLGIPPAVTTPIALSGVLSLGNAATNGGSFTLTATATSLTSSLKGVAWYCGSQPVPVGKCSVSTTGIGTLTAVSTLTMTGVTYTNAGQYSLHATNSSGTGVSIGTLNLTVQNVVSTVVTTVTNVVSFVSSGTGMTDSGFRLRLTGPGGSNVVVQASTDMVHWTSIATNNIPGDGNYSYTDSTAKSRPGRFYRVYLP